MRIEARQDPAADAGKTEAAGQAGAAGLVGAWASENPRSAALHARARRLLPGGVTHDVRLAAPFPVAVERGPTAHASGTPMATSSSTT